MAKKKTTSKKTKKTKKSSKTKNNSKNSEKFTTLIHSMTVEQIKEVVEYYNDNFACDDNFIKSTSKKKDDLKQYVLDSIPDNEKVKIYEKFEPDFIKNLINNAYLLIAGEHKTEEILNAGVSSGGMGYQVWFTSKIANWSHKSEIDVNNINSVKDSCNCRYGRAGGVCIHEMAIYLLLLSKKLITSEDIPFTLDIKWFEEIQKKIDMLAARKLFKEEPAIMLERDYNVFIHGDIITLKWGGTYAGQKTIDMKEEGGNMDDFLVKRISDVMLRKIQAKKGKGFVVKILIDSYGIIDKMLERPKIVKKIMTKISALNDPLLPKSEEELESYLKSDLRENLEEIYLQPPFEAYLGDEPYIFVSYTHKDKVEVFPIIDKLNQEGFNIWYDEGIGLSEEWESFIWAKLGGCKVFLSFISPNVLHSAMTQEEITNAIGEDREIIRVDLKETKLIGGLKLINKIDGIHKYELEDNEFFEKLISEVEKKLGVKRITEESKKSSKKSSKGKKKETIDIEDSDFSMLLKSITIPKIKDIADNYNANYNKNEMIKVSGLKKDELIYTLVSSIPKKTQQKLFDEYQPEIIKKLLEDAVKLIAGEHVTESIVNAGVAPGGKGFQVWFKGRNWKNKAVVDINDTDSIKNLCNCIFGKVGGICIHEIAIYLLLLSQKMITLSDIPLAIDKEWFKEIEKRMDIIASQSLFKEEPSIMFQEDYNIFIHKQFITLKWGGKYPGKTTKDMSNEKDDLDSFLIKKSVDVMLRRFKKKYEGEPKYIIKVLIDSYGIIDKILDDENQVKRILKHMELLENQNLPKNKTDLEIYLKSDLKENKEAINLEKPCEACTDDDSYVYVCYSHQDKVEVYPILKTLNKAGIDIWYDEGNDLSKEQKEKATRMLNGCSIFMSFISPSINESKEMKKEIMDALGEEKTMINIYLHETELEGSLKMIRDVQGLQKYDMTEERFNEKLVKEMIRIVNP